MRAGAAGGRPAGRLAGDPPAPHEPWTAETVPEELLTLLDDLAGMQHSPTGRVASALATILNVYDERSFRS